MINEKLADPADVAATMPCLPAHVAGLVRFMALTGARCDEACRINLARLARSGPVWYYQVAGIMRRVVAVGPQAQDVLREFIRVRCPLCGVEGRPPLIGCRDGALCGPCADRMDEQDICGPWQRVECHPPDAPLFSPAEQREEIDAATRASRMAQARPSEACRRKATAQHPPELWFQVAVVGRAVRRACDKAKVACWPTRHLRRLFWMRACDAAGLDGAEAALGQSWPQMADHYHHIRDRKAVEVARRIG